MADAHALGACVLTTCGFESHLPHQTNLAALDSMPAAASWAPGGP